MHMLYIYYDIAIRRGKIMRRCMMCKSIVVNYYGICSTCKQLNKDMADIHINLEGYTALVTGARIKIGYATCLRLLRDGANVIGITRFPYDAIRRYTEEPDYEDFKERLFIYGFDLRRVDLIGELANFLYEHFKSIDIIINNAAQTIKKSRKYYEELTEIEAKAKVLLHGEVLKCLASSQETYNEQSWLSVNPKYEVSKYEESPNYNSWVSKVEELSVEEMLEVQLINVTAPMLLISRLKELMKKSPHKNRFIINVSSVEGRFNRKIKLARHVHTNMAKASLNMMTHSLSLDYSKDDIYMYNVDPGWVSNQFPEDYEVSKNFVPYLSLQDGATRLTHPIYTFLNEDKIKSIGTFYKDFKPITY